MSTSDSDSTIIDADPPTERTIREYTISDLTHRYTTAVQTWEIHPFYVAAEMRAATEEFFAKDHEAKLEGAAPKRKPYGVGPEDSDE